MEDPLTVQPKTETWPPKLRRAQAAQYLREMHGLPVQPSTLAKWFCTRSDGPPAFIAGRLPLYPREGLDEWAKRRLGTLRNSTSRHKSDLAA